MTNKHIMELKERDVYEIRYTDDIRSKRPNFDYRHCFEGTAVVIQSNNELKLFDTYWGIMDTSGRSFKLKDIGKVIHAKLIAHLDDYETRDEKHEYYDPSDILRITRQHGCSDNCVYYYFKKGSSRSQNRIITLIEKKISEKEQNIRYDQAEILRLNDKLKTVKEGDLVSFWSV